MRRLGIALLIGGGMVWVVAVAALTFAYVMSDTTEYCPWSHRLNDLSSCEVLDRADARVLLQHADHDRNIYYLEIIDAAGVRSQFELPRAITRLAPDGYTAKLIRGEQQAILLNGKAELLKRMR